jgi:hypothetical protein
MRDMPRVDLELLETRAGNACYGANGISHSLTNTHLVIMAIHNAIGPGSDLENVIFEKLNFQNLTAVPYFAPY